MAEESSGDLRGPPSEGPSVTRSHPFTRFAILRHVAALGNNPVIRLASGRSNAVPSVLEEGEADEVENELPFQGFVPRVFFVFKQTTQPRKWCLILITWPYPFHPPVTHLNGLSMHINNLL